MVNFGVALKILEYCQATSVAKCVRIKYTKFGAQLFCSLFKTSKHFLFSIYLFIFIKLDNFNFYCNYVVYVC